MFQMPSDLFRPEGAAVVDLPRVRAGVLQESASSVGLILADAKADFVVSL
jgi:hypothetical protein